MKKITLLIALMLFSFANAQQVVIENFETPTTYSFNKFEGLSDAAVVVDPAVGGSRGNVFKLVSVSTGFGWQGAEVLFSGSKIRLTTDKTMKVDVYSTQAFSILAKAEVGATASATSANYTTPNQWQTLTFNFAVPRDNTAAANGDYGKVAFFPNWKSDNTGFNIPANFTIYVDNITGVKISTAPDFAPPVAPTPTAPNAQVFSIFGDTGGFTNKWVSDYSFGGFLGKPDLDPTAGVNTAIKMDFSTQGYGEGLALAKPRKDVSAYGFLNFDYYVQSGATNAGSLGHQFYIDLIHNAGTTDGDNRESFYGVGPTILSTGPAYEQVAKVIVFDSWQTVSIPLSAFVGFSPANFMQFKIGASSDLRTKVAFFDNIYFSVNNPLGTSKFETSNVRMYPNPAKNTLNIDANNTIEKVAVYSILGQEVMSKSPKSNSTTLQTSGLQKGTYIVKSTIDGKTATSKFIKE